ncbi:hypothetical protein SARC_00976 [Sphaeroforma arctica JP610]|uniref:Uncharacterized protein n=1 Tax=Sphaeroforma arctica JP610 TaxID=667725 RepID=A0A0L0GDB7_9EUKA|nr:hypothetical protein SARC_00976 [Sphaeroforma arctica JP610]KNC86881.1 hypothetical protein SARC_00976 [Sphaeroforma arctica JP610]|eukprot:XP_014160783.1 hypothetical protein SARC_00976 [Sphaeroforma arctica JP610]
MMSYAEVRTATAQVGVMRFCIRYTSGAATNNAIGFPLIGQCKASDARYEIVVLVDTRACGMSAQFNPDIIPESDSVIC